MANMLRSFPSSLTKMTRPEWMSPIGRYRGAERKDPEGSLVLNDGLLVGQSGCLRVTP